MLRGVLAAALAVFFVGGAANAGGLPPIPPPPPASLGAVVNNFGGLQFAISQGGLGNPYGTMTGYAAGDSITLQCSGVTFATPPVIGVVAASGGAVTAATVAVPGMTSGPIPSATRACSQASTTGSGAGYQVSAVLGTVAAYIQPSSLSTGGGAYNGNLFLNQGPSDGFSFNNSGAENVFVGTKAGFGLSGASFYNTALGHNACGTDGTSNSTQGSIVCIGQDAGRNITNGSSSVLVGAGAGRNNAGQFNTFVGFQAGGSNGSNNTGLLSGQFSVVFGGDSATSLTSGNWSSIFGTSSGKSITNGSGNIILGSKTGNSIVSGNNNVLIQATSGTDNCSNGDESNVVAVCAGAGRVLTITGSATPATSNAKFSGSLSASSITTSSTTLHTTSVALSNGAAAGVGTLANAPASGNPTKWVPINDNGTTRYIPAW